MARSSPGGSLPPVTPPSLAVLYFDSLSTDSEGEYFCAGITEDILTDLSKIKGIRVASRNAVARYRGAPADIPKIAAELGVSAVLEGSVRRSGDRVRITAQLINAADGFHLWAERYDRTLQDVFAVQEEIARSIAAALRVALTPADVERIGDNRPEDARAYDLYLRGREQYGRYTMDSLHQALDLFEQAIAVEPTYALAHAGVADCYGQLLQWGLVEDPDRVYKKGLEAARRAIGLNPRMPEGHKAEALVLRHSRDMTGNRAALRRALEADPRFVPALLNLGISYFEDADVARAERLIRRALEVDPQEAFATTWLGWILLFTGRPDDALALSDRLRALSQETLYITSTFTIRGIRQLMRGDLAAAERVAEQGMADGADGASMDCIRAMVFARSGRLEDARRLTAEVRPAKSIAGGTLLLAAGASVRAGEQERAVEFLSRGMIRTLAATFVRLYPELRPLMDQAPYAPRRWAATLVWPAEAPPVDPELRELFGGVRIESGMPKGTEPE